MKNQLKLVLGISAGLLVGITSTYFFMQNVSAAASRPKPEDPFERMERMHANFERLFQSTWPSPQQLGPMVDVEQREDERYWYYEIRLEGMERDDVKVEVVDDTLKIFGELKKSDDSDSGSSYVSHSFQRSLSLPPGADPARVVFDSRDSAIIVKIPKFTAET